MREHLDPISRHELVAYRISRSEETLNEADILAQNEHFSGAMNRLYYACYYVVTALLIANGIQATTHAGVRSMFGMKFVKPGFVSLSHGKFFNEIFELRHSNDYDDFVFCDEETYSVFRPKVEALIETLKSMIK